jgi:hypothetical protein
MLMEETAVGYIPNVKIKQGFFKNPAYTLVVTNKRIIAARITSEIMKENAKQASEESKAKGEGFVKRALSTAASGFNIHRRYESMMPDDIVKENADNFFIPLEAVTKIKLKQGNYDPDYQQSDRVEIHTSSQKYKIELKQLNIKQTKEVLSQVLPTLV